MEEIKKRRDDRNRGEDIYSKNGLEEYEGIWSYERIGIWEEKKRMNENKRNVIDFKRKIRWIKKENWRNLGRNLKK